MLFVFEAKKCGRSWRFIAQLQVSKKEFEFFRKFSLEFSVGLRGFAKAVDMALNGQQRLEFLRQTCAHS